MPKQTLLKIATEKRERLLREAAKLFAERGFEAADMAELAERCGIAKGSLYTYFSSKDDLYLYVCRDGLARSRAAVWAAVEPTWDVVRVLEHTFRAGVAFARERPELVTLYLGVASVGLEATAAQLSDEVERPAAERWKVLLQAGIHAGVVRADLDVPVAAWQINNAYVMLLAALVSEHFGIRLRAYLDLPRRLSAPQSAALCERVLGQLTTTLQDPRPRRRS
ncbi:MAG: TetR/AcrR family transcriptional regulator [Deltaproteobacteria bacterium]|nr:TetR/AcrR family transcriptional regulator [Deltaproteobacteria bacterium]